MDHRLEPVQQLMARVDGAVMGQLGRPVSADELHTAWHVTKAAEGPFPEKAGEPAQP